jgi:phosphoglycerate dehydrogenase-like enzyme
MAVEREREREREILVTDSLFIDKGNVEELERAGFKVTRLDKPEATEAELCEAVKGKSGYILGGIEKVTRKVIDSADRLKAIVFTGSAYAEFIPAWKEATAKGIAIGNAPGANAPSVAEYTVTLALAMLRNVLELGRTGAKKFQTARSVRDATFGVVGLGKTGTAVAKLLKALGAKEILYYSKTRKEDAERKLDIKYASLDEVLGKSDVVTLHTPITAGKNFIDASKLKKMKDNAILIDVAKAELVDFDALKKEIKAGRLRAAYDAPPHGDYSDLPAWQFFCSNMQTAYNTIEANTTASNMATKTMINLLKTGEDKYLVNPEYKKNRK